MSDYIKHKEYKLPNGGTVTAYFNELGLATITIQAMDALFDILNSPDAVEVVRCKDCRHFEYDHPYIIQGIPVLGHEVCNAWGGGCKTDENGYCFMAERRDGENEQTVLCNRQDV